MHLDQATPLAIARWLWRQAGGDETAAERLDLIGADDDLDTAFRVGALATAVVGATLLAADELRRQSGGPAAAGERVRVTLDEALASFASERLLRLNGASPGELWSPLSGDYRTADGWVRLHANFPNHAAAIAAALGVPEEPDAVRAAAARLTGRQVEQDVLAAGGAAAAMRDRAAWRASEPGRATLDGSVLRISPRLGEDTGRARLDGTVARPLAGLRVVELTRVIAGPVAGRVLTALGAQVTHVRAERLPTIPTADLDTGFGKQAVLLDLRAAPDRLAFEALVSDADVLVQSYRPGALAGLGYPPGRLAALRPGLVVGQVSAYGPDGPWAGRRGFDSLVQMAAGIADEGMRRAGADRPVPLPVQALDHATGWLTALAVLTALATPGQAGARVVDASLARTATLLDALGRKTPGPRRLPHAELIRAPASVGVLDHVPMPGRIGGEPLAWTSPPSPARRPPLLD